MEAEQTGKKRVLGTQPKARAGWPKRLGLVRATLWADFAVISDTLINYDKNLSCVALS